MVDAVRHVEAALGDGHKHLTESEAPNKTVARKSIVAARAIKGVADAVSITIPWVRSPFAPGLCGAGRRGKPG